MNAISLRQPQIPINPVGGAVAKGQPNATGAKHRREHPETGLIGICGAEKTNSVPKPLYHIRRFRRRRQNLARPCC